MAFYLSAGVYTKETDLSNLVAAISTTSAAIVGRAEKGSSDVKLITSPNAFLAEYGTPTINSNFHYAALAYLSQGNTLYTKRVIGETASSEWCTVADVTGTGPTTITMDSDLVGTYTTDGVIWNMTQNKYFFIAATGTDTVQVTADVSGDFDVDDVIYLLESDELDLWGGLVYKSTGAGVQFAYGSAQTSEPINIGGDSLFTVFARNAGTAPNTYKTLIENVDQGNEIANQVVDSVTTATRSIVLDTGDENISAGDKVYDITQDTIYTVESYTHSTTTIVTRENLAIVTAPVASDELQIITGGVTFDIVIKDMYDAQLERWTVSRSHVVDGMNKQLYLETVINGYSAYITVQNNLDITEFISPTAVDTAVNLAEGKNSSITDWDSAIAAQWGSTSDLYDPEKTDFRLAIEAGAGVLTQKAMVACAEARKDCFAILDMPESAITNEQMLTHRNTTLNVSSSYAGLYAGWLKQNDSWNNTLVNQPPSGFVAAQAAYTGQNNEIWLGFAGEVKGRINALGVTRKFNQGDRDILYANQINPIQQFTGAGIQIFGQKTLQKKSSRLSSINVRMLLIVIEKSLSAYLRGFLFEPHTELTRFLVKAGADEFMDDLRARDAFQLTSKDPIGYQIVCDEQNNTPAIVDRNELHVDVLVKPISIIEYIQLQAVVTKTGVSFEELISRGVLI